MDYRSMHKRHAHELALAYDSLYFYLNSKRFSQDFGYKFDLGYGLNLARRDIARLLCEIQNKRGDIPDYKLKRPSPSKLLKMYRRKLNK